MKKQVTIRVGDEEFTLPVPEIGHPGSKEGAAALVAFRIFLALKRNREGPFLFTQMLPNGQVTYVYHGGGIWDLPDLLDDTLDTWEEVHKKKEDL